MQLYSLYLQPAQALPSGPRPKCKVLVIFIDDKFAPLGFRDEKNNLVGFDIDYAKQPLKKWAKR
ncbi:hypothetical protein AM500_19590 [Bacillus sp. FJAT-18017]|nr:hypothetical protein AM500_19590 [Bacillus sp. FJAT-18017]